ncbi:MAG: hypothetical protein ACE5HE_09330 [Phycisphaerae bacterium]
MMSGNVTATAVRKPTPRRRWLWAAAAVVLTSAFAWSRVGMFDLPALPRGLGIADTGLADLPELKRLDRFVRGSHGASESAVVGLSGETLEAARLVRDGLKVIREGDSQRGLEMIREGARRAPANLVFGNAYRMAVFTVQRALLASSRRHAQLGSVLPPYIANEPVAFFEALSNEDDAREIRVQLALSWVDRMLLFPALEIKAPASVEAVNILTKLIDDGNPGYVPALFARGLNNLHRPARLVWPEADKTPPDAAARDLGLCVAIGRTFGTVSSRLQAILALAVGDAYVKAGRLGVARSWWQIAQNRSGDPSVQQAVRRRYGWPDAQVLDRLEEELDRARSELDNPMTDLALMWD